MAEEAKITLTEAQIAERIKKDEEAWELAKKMAEIGEYAAASANRIYEALSLAGYTAPQKETFFGMMAIVVTLAKERKLKVEDIVSQLFVLYRGIDVEAVYQEEKNWKPEDGGPGPL